ncbi:MAG: hypothetical protein ACI4QA_01065 [Candidatus Spyradosoma sp.]
MTKTILSLVGLIAVGVVAYTFATGKKPDFVVEAEKNALREPAAQAQQPAAQPAPASAPVQTQQTAAQPAPVSAQVQQPAAQPESAPQPAPASDEKKNDPNDPLSWDMTMIRKDPIRYFTTALADAKEKHESIKAREGTMRVKQLELQRKVDENQAKADGLRTLLQQAVDAYKAADEKYKGKPTAWVADFPYKGARTKQLKMKQYLVKIKKRSEMAQLVSDKTNGVNVQYQNAILVAEKKAFELEMAIESLTANKEMAEAGKTLEEINFDQESINKYVDVSTVYMEMDGGDQALDALAKGAAVTSEYDADLKELGI